MQVSTVYHCVVIYLNSSTMYCTTEFSDLFATWPVSFALKTCA